MAVAAGNGGDGPEEGVGESSSPPHDPAPAPVPAPAASGGSGGGVRGGGLRDICREVFERLVNDGYLAGSELLAQLEALFNRLPMSHKLDVNIDKAEDVLIHQKVLAEAKDPDRRPAFAVRFLRLEEVNVDETTNSDAHEEGADIGEALSTRYDGCMLEVSRTKGFPLSTSKNPNSVLPSPSMMQKIHKVTKVLPDFNPDTKDFLINNTRRMVLQPLKICDEDEDDSGNEFLSSAKLPKSGNCTTHIDDELVPKNSKKFCFDNLDDGCLLEVSGTKGSLLSTSKNPNSVLPSPSMMQKIHKVFSDEEIEDILSQWINNPHYLLPSNVYSIDIYTKECFEELEQYSTDGVAYFVVHLKHMRNGFNRKMANSLYSWKQANVYARERSILKIMKYAEGKTYVRYRCMKEYTMKGGPENIVFCEISSHEWRDGRKDQKDPGAQDPGAHDPGAHGLSDIRRKDLGAHAPALSVRFHLTSGGMEGRTRRTLVHMTLVHMALVI